MSEKASHLMKRPQVSRILYVYDDPTDAVMSLFRNGYSWSVNSNTNCRYYGRFYHSTSSRCSTR